MKDQKIISIEAYSSGMTVGDLWWHLSDAPQDARVFVNVNGPYLRIVRAYLHKQGINGLPSLMLVLEEP